ncbi:cobalamin biosynthesis protein [Thioalkalivibrio sp. ALJ24]|uniref:cobalamin biosynthesis protein n=1 Tax=Thioalkalivibrio sp. ALJ24 TaxID=545276 RepID=UPI00038278DA|nr:cobalamin biosynthesis protein [Thioalkalivibrio sp. ALJ24]
MTPGVGFASACTAGELEALVREMLAEAHAGLRAGGGEAIEIRQLAAPAHKGDSPVLWTAARDLELEPVFASAAALAALAARDAALSTESARSRAAAGVGSVAEAAALAVAGDGARLLLPRRLSARASCAVAVRTVNGTDGNFEEF